MIKNTDVRADKLIKKNVVILNSKLARKLIKSGHIVIDIKPHRNLLNGTVFVFRNCVEIQRAIKNFNI